MKGALADNVRKLEFSRQIKGAVAGRIVETDPNGRVLVDFPGNPREPVQARLTRSVKTQLQEEKHIFPLEVLLVFENNNPERPVIVDILCSGLEEGNSNANTPEEIRLDREKPEEVEVDGRKITFTAKEEIVLRCGKSSITLTKAGKVIIRGAYLLNRSSGVNKIKGGSVQIN
ncbi:MAG: DUF2345 domain-containing protein [Desulfobacteraceae bacterium]|nr:DUF2345 domain-containing protein [Desulfobacteraceae bacterium]